MTKIEFRAALASKLQSIPLAERAKPLDYYDEMICDRMEDGMSEADAVADLGNIDDIANEILSQYTITSLAPVTEAPKNEGGSTNTGTPEFDSYDAKNEPKREKRRSNAGLWIAVGVLGFPFWIALAAMAFALIIGLWCIVWAIVISVGAMLAATLAVGVVGIPYGIYAIFAVSPPYAIYVIGTALVSLAIMLVLVIVIRYVFKGAVWISKQPLKLFKRRKR
ncbi:MAG: DUF1700 domain-containing protein [Clostridiales bacterium]|nr:DUF1700 domain-containing protein [Clostridiales bacterium]